MRPFRYLLLTAVVSMAGVNAAAQQPDWAKVTIKPTKAAGNVYVLEGLGGNIGVSAGEDGVLIVDDQFAPLADKIRAALQSISPGKLKFVLNTHYHGDHTGSNAVFGPEAPIIAQTNVRKRLQSEQKVAGEVVKPAPKQALPVLTFDDSMSVHFNGEEIQLIHFPNGHTDGDTVVFFTKSNVVHMGDDFFAGRFPFVDIDAGGNVVSLTKNVGEVIKKLPADVKIIPGHGPLSSLDDLKKYHQMLVETTEFVRTQKASGKSLDEIKKQGLPDQWKSWGWEFISADRWVELVFRSLS
jgi:cyclase